MKPPHVQPLQRAPLKGTPPPGGASAVALAEHHGHLGRDGAIAGETGEAEAQEVQPSYGQRGGSCWC